MRTRVRDQKRSDREPRKVPVHDTALWHGALMEITRQGVEITRLRTLLLKHGIDPEESA